MSKKITYRDIVFDIVKQIPAGKVASYGQISKLIPGCTARMVGYALASLPNDSGVPWQRVINSKGKISPHGAGFGSAMQRALLEQEGIIFSKDNSIEMSIYSWIS
ncbi:MAG: cysteine methyltransferase [Chloroflexi bacterium HGW-Chloroflexi-3]|nr:MAG: cysteine methyltransferase [Chloroflexi bacterium HGW-Chloroflexi-3]